MTGDGEWFRYLMGIAVAVLSAAFGWLHTRIERVADKAADAPDEGEINELWRAVNEARKDIARMGGDMRAHAAVTQRMEEQLREIRADIKELTKLVGRLARDG